jgi:hypothetical protein
MLVVLQSKMRNEKDLLFKTKIEKREIFRQDLRDEQDLFCLSGRKAKSLIPL